MTRAYDREWQRDAHLVKSCRELEQARSLVRSALVKTEKDKRTRELVSRANAALVALTDYKDAVETALAGSPRLFTEEGA